MSAVDGAAPDNSAVKRAIYTHGPAALLFVVTALFTLIWRYPVLYFDHWDLVPLYERWANGSLRFSDLFAPHGTHWHAGGYAIMLALAALTGMDQGAEVTASLALAVIAWAAIYSVVRETAARAELKHAPIIVFACALFLFSLDQSENWLWGWQIALFLNLAGSAWTIALLSRPNAGLASLAGAMVAAALAIYSFATGLALLPAGLIVLLIARRKFDMRAGLWIAFSLTIALHYKIAVLDVQPDYVAEITPGALNASTVTSLISYFLTVLGAAIGRFSDGLPLILSVLGLCLASWTLWRSRLAPEAAGATGLVLYGAGASLLIAYGRLGFDNAVISRYISFANFFWIGLILLGWLTLAKRPKMARAALALLLICKVATIANVLHGGAAGIKHAEQVRAAAFDLCRTYPNTRPETIAALSTPKQNITAALKFVAQEKLSIFRKCPDP